MSTSSDGDNYDQDTIKNLTPPDEVKFCEQQTVQDSNKSTSNESKSTDTESKSDAGNSKNHFHI